MPLGHAAMIIMEKFFGHEYIYHAALLLGIIGFSLIVWGVIINKETKSTFLWSRSSKIQLLCRL